MSADAVQEQKPIAKLARKRAFIGSSQISMITRAKARNLYVIQMLPAREVAKEVGLTEKQIYKLAVRHQWPALRRERMERLSEPLQAREREQAEEVAVAAAALSDQGLLGSLIRANEAVESRSEFASKDAQAFASAARSLMQVGRTLRGLDKEAPKSSGDTVNVMFMGTFARVTAADATPSVPSAPEEKRVSGPCIDVATTPSSSTKSENP